MKQKITLVKYIRGDFYGFQCLKYNLRDETDTDGRGRKENVKTKKGSEERLSHLSTDK